MTGSDNMNEIIVFERDEYSQVKQIQDQIPERYGCAYILEYGEYVKIGCSSRPYRRLKELKIAAENYGDCELGRLAVLPCCKNFGVVEGYLHTLFDRYRKRKTELFKVDFDAVLEEVYKRDINYCNKIKIEVVEKQVEEEPKEKPKDNARDLYWQRRLGEMERRIEKAEARLSALEKNPTNNSDYYTIKEFAAALGVSRLTITRRIADGKIDAEKVGRTWRIPKTELHQIFD